MAWTNATYAVNTECSGTLTESGNELITHLPLGNRCNDYGSNGNSQNSLVAQIVTPTNVFTTMTAGANQTFTKTLTGQTLDATITYAFYFAWAGGGVMRTSNLTYTVGSTCSSVPDDSEIPTGFTAPWVQFQQIR
jgi:hypothetical protein